MAPVSIYQQSPASYSYLSDKQKTKAEKFVNKSEQDITKMAAKQYKRKYSESDKKFAKKVGITLNSVPLIAVASGLLTKKGAAASLRQGAEWGLALLAPTIVGGINNTLTKAHPKLKETERKHSGLAFLTQCAASVGAFFGMSALMNKALDNKTVKNTANNVLENAGKTYKNVKGKFKLSPDMSKKVADAKAKIKVPEFAKPTVDRIANSETFGKAMKTTKNIGKSLVKHAPMLTVLGIGAALIGKSISDANKFSSIRSNIKNAQFDTAKELVNTYKAENEALKDDYISKAAELEEIKTAIEE